jgi:hypothetical protein
VVVIRLSQQLAMGNLNNRILSVLTLVVAVTISCLVTAVLYRRTDESLPIVALVILYGLLAWQLRWWRELMYRIPVTIICGAMLLSMLRPATVARRFPSRELFSTHQGFYAVNWALAGAAFFTLVILLCAPMSIAEHKPESTPRPNGG